MNPHELPTLISVAFVLFILMEDEWGPQLLSKRVLRSQGAAHVGRESRLNIVRMIKMCYFTDKWFLQLKLFKGWHFRLKFQRVIVTLSRSEESEKSVRDKRVLCFVFYVLVN